MYELKKIGRVFMSKFVGTGPSSYKKEFTGLRSHKGWENCCKGLTNAKLCTKINIQCSQGVNTAKNCFSITFGE